MSRHIYLDKSLRNLNITMLYIKNMGNEIASQFTKKKTIGTDNKKFENHAQTI